MQQFPTHRSSSTPLLIAAVGLGALVAYALSSPRRRAALRAASESALEAGSRFATASADRLRNVLPNQTLDAASGLEANARGASGRIASATADTLHDARDWANEAMHEVLARVRKLSADTRRGAREQVRGAQAFADETPDDGTVGRSAGRGVVIAAAVIGSGLYAMQRYGASRRAGGPRSANRPNQPKAGSAPDRDAVLEAEREANERQPENFKDAAVTEKVIDLGPVDPKDSNIKDLDPPRPPADR